jgi:hypothetical protein
MGRLATKKNASKQLTKRDVIERRVVSKLVKDALQSGYRLAVDDGKKISEKYVKYQEVMQRLFKAGNEFLVYFNEQEQFIGWVNLIHDGSNGYDVITNYTKNVEPAVLPAQKLAERFQPLPAAF